MLDQAEGGSVERIEETAATKTRKKTAKASANGRIDRLVHETRQLSDDVIEWVNLRLRLVQIDLQERLDDELDFVFSSVMVIAMACIALLLASFAAAFVLGDLLGADWYGFAILSVTYLVAALLIARRRPRMASGFRAGWAKSRMDESKEKTEEAA